MSRRSQGGQAILIVVVAVFVLLGAIGLAVDGGYAYFTSSRADTAAFAAAEAAGAFLPDTVAAAAEAVNVARLNGYPAGQVAVAFLPSGPTPTVVQVTVRQSSPVFFLQLLGAGRQIAVTWTESSRPRPPLAGVPLHRADCPAARTVSDVQGRVTVARLVDSLSVTVRVTGGRPGRTYDAFALAATCGGGRYHAALPLTTDASGAGTLTFSVPPNAIATPDVVIQIVSRETAPVGPPPRADILTTAPITPGTAGPTP